MQTKTLVGEDEVLRRTYEFPPKVGNILRQELLSASRYRVDWVSDSRAVVRFINDTSDSGGAREDAGHQDADHQYAPSSTLPTFECLQSEAMTARYTAANGTLLEPWKFYNIGYARREVVVIGGRVFCRARQEVDGCRVPCAVTQSYGLPCRHVLAACGGSFQMHDVPYRYHKSFAHGKWDTTTLPVTKAMLRVGVELPAGARDHNGCCRAKTNSDGVDDADDEETTSDGAADDRSNPVQARAGPAPKRGSGATDTNGAIVSITKLSNVTKTTPTGSYMQR